MLGNLISGRDLYRFGSDLPRHAAMLARRLLLSGRGRTVDTWNSGVRDDTWASVPAIQRRWNTLVSGDAGVDHHAWVAQRYLAGGGLRALAVGCGDGVRELEWARTGRFASLVGIDLAPAAIASAQAAARAAGLDGIVTFRVGDLSDREVLGSETFDVVIGERSVHHLSPLREILTSLRERLVPGGLFLLDDYVGPTRFQWTDAQLEAINHLLPLLPQRLRRKCDGGIKEREHRPSLLYMLVNDPSEAVESAAILPLMDELFERVDLRPYGGAILHMLLSKIGHNFPDGDEQAQWWLALLARIEDELMASGRLASDFAVAVYRRR
jgi:SAM-dependent methyltransferase